MTNEEKRLFGILHNQSVQIAKVLESPQIIGVWESIVELYAESAHFIYELIQNADDALAEQIEIILYHDKLIFKHNGKKHFTISDDKAPKAKRGSINAIVSIGNSNKLENETIGKFGLGFKSVFSYTNTPYIYDDNFLFKIEKKIIPTLIYSDHPLRNSGETLFEFPFINTEKSYDEIKHRLLHLNMPILFMPHIKTIRWKIEGDTNWHIYTKENIKTYNFGEIKCNRLQLNECGLTKELFLFTRKCKCIENFYDVSVGYFLDEN